MDADDVATKDRLEVQVSFMDCHPEIGVLGGAVEWINAAGKSLTDHRFPCQDSDIKALLYYGSSAVWHPTALLRTDVFSWSGGYRNVFEDGADYDLWLRLADRFQLANLFRIVLKYRIHPHQVSMQKRVQQTQRILAAKLAAKRRKEGLLDPLTESTEITAETLVGWGVSAADQRAALFKYSADWIQNMCGAGEYSTALDAATKLLQSGSQGISRRQLADLRLLVGALLWRDRRFLRSVGSIVRAVFTRPIVAGRPLKRLLSRSVAGAP